MIKNLLLPALSAIALTCAPAMADGDDHDHSTYGPNGGRVLHQVHPHAELLVTKERKLQFTFLSHSGKAIAPKGQSIVVICGQRSNPVKMSFAPQGKSLISDKSLPEGKQVPTVISMKMSPSQKATIIRLNLKPEDYRNGHAKKE